MFALGASACAGGHPGEAAGNAPVSSTTAQPAAQRPTTSTTRAGERRARKHNAPRDIYAAGRPNEFSPAVSGFRPLVYVPNSLSNTVDVIDAATYQEVNHFAVGQLPQHVVPSWDLKTMYVANDLGNSLTVIDPRTGAPGRVIPVDDPYNLYFTVDGRFAIVVAERLGRLDFRDPHTFELVHSLSVPCSGVDHLDF